MAIMYGTEILKSGSYKLSQNCFEKEEQTVPPFLVCSMYISYRVEYTYPEEIWGIIWQQ